MQNLLRKQKTEKMTKKAKTVGKSKFKVISKESVPGKNWSKSKQIIEQILRVKNAFSKTEKEKAEQLKNRGKNPIMTVEEQKSFRRLRTKKLKILRNKQISELKNRAKKVKTRTANPKSETLLRGKKLKKTDRKH